MSKLHNKHLKMKEDLKKNYYGPDGITSQIILHKGEFVTLLYTEPFVIVLDAQGSVFRLSSIDQMEEV